MCAHAHARTLTFRLSSPYSPTLKRWIHRHVHSTSVFVFRSHFFGIFYMLRRLVSFRFNVFQLPHKIGMKKDRTAIIIYASISRISCHLQWKLLNKLNENELIAFAQLKGLYMVVHFRSNNFKCLILWHDFLSNKVNTLKFFENSNFQMRLPNPVHWTFPVGLN